MSKYKTTTVVDNKTFKDMLSQKVDKKAVKATKKLFAKLPKDKHKFVNIKCTEYQAFLIERCLEIVSRIGAGQLDNIEDAVSLCRGNAKEVRITNEVIQKLNDVVYDIREESLHDNRFAWLKLGRAVCDLTKPILFPELHRQASFGIGHSELPNMQIMYEIYKRLGNRRAKVEKHSKMSVMHDAPLHYSKEPLIEVTEVK